MKTKIQTLHIRNLVQSLTFTYWLARFPIVAAVAASTVFVSPWPVRMRLYSLGMHEC